MILPSSLTHKCIVVQRHALKFDKELRMSDEPENVHKCRGKSTPNALVIHYKWPYFSVVKGLKSNLLQLHALVIQRIVFNTVYCLVPRQVFVLYVTDSNWGVGREPPEHELLWWSLVKTLFGFWTVLGLLIMHNPQKYNDLSFWNAYRKITLKIIKWNLIWLFKRALPVKEDLSTCTH